MTLFLLALSSAFAADSIVTVRDAADLGTLAVVMSCGDAPDQSYTKDSDALSDVLKARIDIDGLVRIDSATPADIHSWLVNSTAALNGAQFHRLFLVVSCPATGGDEDDENIATGGGTLRFADLTLGFDKMAESSVVVLDASRNGYGATADDPLRLGMHDAYAISSGSPGKFADIGLVPALTATLNASKGGLLTLDDLSKGIKMQALALGFDLNIYDSRGILTVDQWSGGRQVLKGGGLIAEKIVATPVAPIAPPPSPLLRKEGEPDTAHHFRPGLIVAGGGVAAGIGAGVFGASAINEYKLLVEYNELGNTTDENLNATASRYRLDTGLTVGLGVGSLALIGTGIVWTVLDHGAHPVTVTPTGTGVVVGGTF